MNRSTRNRFDVPPVVKALAVALSITLSAIAFRTSSALPALVGGLFAFALVMGIETRSGRSRRAAVTALAAIGVVGFVALAAWVLLG